MYEERLTAMAINLVADVAVVGSTSWGVLRILKNNYNDIIGNITYDRVFFFFYFNVQKIINMVLRLFNKY